MDSLQTPNSDKICVSVETVAKCLDRVKSGLQDIVDAAARMDSAQERYQMDIRERAKRIRKALYKLEDEVSNG